MQTPEQLVNLPLRQSHPSLFKSLVVKALFIIIAGLMLSTGQATYLIEEAVLYRNGQSPLVPFEFWGAAFILTGSVLLYGITNGLNRYKWARRGMIMAAALCGIFAVGYWFSYLQGLTGRVFAPMFWTYLTCQFIIWAGEPAFNPLSSALNEGGKDVGR